MKQYWTVKNKKENFTEICREQGITEVTARLLVNRGLTTKQERDAFLHPSFSNFEQPERLKNAEKAGFKDRINFVSGNVLDETTKLPEGAHAVWMSQFLDCFSLSQITKILTKIYNSVDENCDIYVMEPLWDMQKYEGESYALQATSLYFTCIANGNSKMYRYGELVEAIEKAGFKLVTAHHNLGSNFYSILNFRKK